jgi:MYXO-CTERM domain-containing protein
VVAAPDAAGPVPDAGAAFAPDAARSPDAVFAPDVAFSPDVGGLVDARMPTLGPDTQPGTQAATQTPASSSGCGLAGRPSGRGPASFGLALLGLAALRRRRGH